MLQLKTAWSQSQGKRAYQQDGLTKQVWPNGFSLVVLSDGMGGAVHGDIASEEILTSYNQAFCQSDESDLSTRLQDSLFSANKHLTDYIEGQPECRGMGGTIVATAFTGQELYWLSVGDSPLWLIRDNQIHRLNQDHSKKAEFVDLVAVGEMTQAELDTHPQRNQLTSAVMGTVIDFIDNDHIDLLHGDIILLASDGIETISEKEILSICQRFSQAEPQALSDYIVSYVENINKTHQDNSTLMVMTLSQK